MSSPNHSPDPLDQLRNMQRRARLADQDSTYTSPSPRVAERKLPPSPLKILGGIVLFAIVGTGVGLGAYELTEAGHSDTPSSSASGFTPETTPAPNSPSATNSPEATHSATVHPSPSKSSKKRTAKASPSHSVVVSSAPKPTHSNVPAQPTHAANEDVCPADATHPFAPVNVSPNDIEVKIHPACEYPGAKLEQNFPTYLQPSDSAAKSFDIRAGDVNNQMQVELDCETNDGWVGIQIGSGDQVSHGFTTESMIAFAGLYEGIKTQLPGCPSTYAQ